MVRVRECGPPAVPGCASTCGTTTTTAAIAPSSRRSIPVMKGAAEFFLDTLVPDASGRFLVTSPSISPENEHPAGRVHLRGTGHGQPDPARPVRELHQRGGNPARGRGLSRRLRRGARQTTAGPGRQGGAIAGVARGLGHGGAGAGSSARVASLCAVSQRADHRAAHAAAGGRREAFAGAARRPVHGLGDRLAHQPLGAAARRRPHARRAQTTAGSLAHLSQHVRRAPAVPDRREFRRCERHPGDARAMRRRRDRAAARAAARMAGRFAARPAGARRIRAGYGLARG